MALYNSYFPPNYQPAYSYVPQFQQQPQQQNMTQASSLIWVSNFNEAQMYPVAPNNAVALWDQGSPVVYLKQADASGKPSLKIYDLVERSQAPQETSAALDEKLHGYATKDDVAGVAASVRSLKEIVSDINREIELLHTQIKEDAE